MYSAVPVHCPKLLKLSRDILRSVDATKCNGAELLGLYSRNKMLYGFVFEFHNILRNRLWFCPVHWKVSARDRTHDLLLRNAPLYLYTTAAYPHVFATEILVPPPYTQAASAVPPVLPRFPQYIAGVSEHSIMVNQNSLCFDTEKWFLCNNTILFV